MADKKKPKDEWEDMGFQEVPEAQSEATAADWEALGAASPPEVGPVETYVLRGAGALPAGGPVSDVLATGVAQALRRFGQRGTRATLTPEAQAELEAMGVETPAVKGPVEEYRDIRDTRRLRTAAGSEQNPWAGRLGTATGIASTIFAPFLPKGTPAAGTGVLGRLGAGAATGAGYGALSGLTEGEADLTRGDVLGAARDTLAGGLFGGAFGLGGAGLVETARPLAGALRRFAQRRARDVLQGGSDIAAATRQPLSAEAAEEALASGAIRPLSTTQATYNRLEQLAAEQGDEYGRIVSELEQRGVQGPDARRLADELLTRGAELERQTLIEGVPARYLERAGQVSSKADQQTGRLGLQQAENLKRSSQQMARFERLTNSPVEEAEQAISSRLRQSVEDAIDEAARAPNASPEVRALAERFVPTKQRLGRLLEARTFAERGAAKAAQRQPLGLKDYMLGMTTGDPVSALGTAMVSGLARNRVPSALATDTYALSQALASGTAGPAFASGASGAQRMRDDLTDWAANEPVDQNTPGYKQALIRLLLALPKEQ